MIRKQDLCFFRQPNDLQYREMQMIAVLSVFPAVLMAVGIIELISERIHKQDRVLTKKRLLRGFGKCGFLPVVLFLLNFYDCFDEMHGREAAEKSV